LLGGWQMRIRWVKLPGPVQQLVDLVHFRRCDIRVARQSLGNEGVGLHLVEQLVPLESQRLHLLGRIRDRQGLIRRIKPLTKLFSFGT
jgi:hypothetical protein